MKFKVAIVFLLLIIILIPSCDTTEPPPPNGEKPTLTLKFEETSCTEAWIKLETTNLSAIGGQATLILKQNEAVRDTINLGNADTLLYIDSLLPNTNYQYQVSSIQHQVSSNELSVTTMDTTSHDFTFTQYTFGGTAGSSTLYDVAIIDENNIWAVGEMYVADTSQNGYTMYNAVHWDGNEWKLKRIYYYGSCSAVEYPPLKAIWAFSDTNIVVTNGGSIGWFDGNTVNLDCRVNPLLTGAINKIWGSSSSDLYVVGNNGTIVHYNGTSWQRIESGTDVDLKDVYGTPDGKAVWISGYEDFKPVVLLKIYNSIIEIVFNTRDYLSEFNPDHISGEITSVWTNSNNFVYITTPYSLYRKSIYDDPAIERALRFGDPLSWLGRRSRGTDINNIFIAGNRGNVHHYNGVTFKTYQELADNGVTYYSLDVKGYLSVICGRKFENGISDKAIITLIN